MFLLQNTTKTKISKKGFEKISDYVLGKKYELSLVFIGDKKAKYLNKKYRKKDYSADILSFSYEDDSGEIFINIGKIKKDAKKYKSTFKNRLTYIFIHGVLHLKGLSHGSTMDKKEKELTRRFSI